MIARLYRLLTRLYPPRFREEFGPGIYEAFESRWASRSTGVLRFLAFHLKDLLASLVREHVDALKQSRRNLNYPPRGENMLTNALNDAKYAQRTLRRSPGFSAIVVLTIALGIGLTTAIFSVVNGVLLRPLPFPNADRLVWGVGAFSGSPTAAVSPPDFLDYRNENTVFQFLVGRRSPGSYAMTGTGPAEQVQGQTVTAGFFEVLGSSPVLGRTFSRADETSSGSRIVVLSYGFWQRAFGGENDVVDRTITLDGVPHDIVGVMPEGFQLFNAADLWSPLNFEGEFNQIRRFHNLRLVGLLRPGVSVETAQTELDVISSRLEAAYPASNATWRLVITPLRDAVVGNIRSALLVLLGAVSFVLLIACGNVANLLLARGATRRTELGLRAALGASRARVVKLLLMENLVFSLVGGLCGIGIAFGGVTILRRLNPQNLPRLDEVSLNPSVLAFAFGVSILSAFVFGIVPALIGSRATIAATLAQRGRSGDVSGGHTRGLLVSCEMALALVLLVGAGLLIKSFMRLTDVEPGFQGEDLLVGYVSLPNARYDTPESVFRFFESVQEGLVATAGVEGAAWTNIFPLSGNGNDTYLAVPGRHELGTESQFNAQNRSVSANYFDVMGIPVLRGRPFSKADTRETAPVVIIDASFAQSIFPEVDPIGQRLQIDFGEVYEAEIVGVVGEVRHFSLSGSNTLSFYLPSQQLIQPSNVIVVRTSGEPQSVASTLSGVVSKVDPDQPVSGISPVTDLLDRSVAQPRFQMILLGIFAAAALALAGIGIYGVLGYYVAQRSREVGIRLALGARKADVYRLVLGRAFIHMGAGLVAGLVGVVTLTRFMTGLLFGVTPTDPATIVSVVVVLCVVALLASYLPVRRALRVDPALAWRE